MSDFREAASVELLRLEEDALYTEKTHFVAAETWDRVHLTIGLAATICAAASAATVISEAATWLSGLLALLAAIASAVLTFVQPDKKGAQHLAAGRSLGELRVRMRHVRCLDLATTTVVDEAEIRASIEDLRAQKASVDSAAPGTSQRQFLKAQSVIQSGTFEHDSVPT